MSATLKTLADKLPQITAACRANDVKQLDLFGSRARADAMATSDADFLVEFNDPLRAGILDRYLALREALMQIMGCQVDLVERSAIENPIMCKRIAEDKATLYAA